MIAVGRAQDKVTIALGRFAQPARANPATIAALQAELIVSAIHGFIDENKTLYPIF